MITYGWNAWRSGMAVALLATSASSLAAPPTPSLREAGRVQVTDLIELSGLAPSQRVAGRWWGHNDSGGGAWLYAFDERGQEQGRVLATVGAFDWEDMASYRQQGLALLAVADTGDNFSARNRLSVQVFEEPPAELPAQLTPVRTIEFRFEDGPRDCEGLAADPAQDRFLLVDKARHPVGLYALPMHPPPGIAVARRIASLPSLYPGAGPPADALGASRYRGTPTALDLSPDGLRLLLLTYTHLLELRREPAQSWADAARAGTLGALKLPRTPLLEAAAYDADGRGALVSGERANAPIRRWNGRFDPRPAR